jgi:hypothetical protein
MPAMGLTALAWYLFNGLIWGITAYRLRIYWRKRAWGRYAAWSTALAGSLSNTACLLFNGNRMPVTEVVFLPDGLHSIASEHSRLLWLADVHGLFSNHIRYSLGDVLLVGSLAVFFVVGLLEVLTKRK